MQTIYVLSNPLFPGIVKIGRTRNLKRRLNSLNTAVPVNYTVSATLQVEDAVKAERSLFHALYNCRVHKRKEFFRCSPEEAVQTLLLQLIPSQNRSERNKPS